MEPIDDYVALLERALRGPRRAKADLLAEARDSLHDATSSYMDGGLSRLAAAERAVADFGPVPVVAPGFQAELSVAQARRTAIWVALVIAVQPVAWGPLRPAGSAVEVTATQATLDPFIDGLGLVALCGALLALLASGIGARIPAAGIVARILDPRHRRARLTGMRFGLARLTGVRFGLARLTAVCPGLARLTGTRFGLARLTGVFGLIVAAGMVAMGGAMLASAGWDQLWAPAGLPWAVAFLLAPMAVVALSARRCLLAS